MTGGAELLLQPIHRLGEKRGGLLCKSPALLVELGAEASQGASGARKLVLVPVHAVHERKQSLFRRTQPVQLVAERPKLRQTPLYDGLAQLALGLEIVVDIAYWDIGGFGNIREAGLPEAPQVREIRRSLNQPCPFVRSRFRHPQP